MVITGERRDEGGMRSVPRKDNTAMCFAETGSGQYRLRPLYYVTDADKWRMPDIWRSADRTTQKSSPPPLRRGRNCYGL